jgi:hypothetical protein
MAGVIWCADYHGQPCAVAQHTSSSADYGLLHGVALSPLACLRYCCDCSLCGIYPCLTVEVSMQVAHLVCLVMISARAVAVNGMVLPGLLCCCFAILPHLISSCRLHVSELQLTASTKSCWTSTECTTQPGTAIQRWLRSLKGG